MVFMVPQFNLDLVLGFWGIQLLHPDNYLSPFSLNEAISPFKDKIYLVAYFADWVHIAILQKYDTTIIVFNFHSNNSVQSIFMDMEIWDIWFTNNTISIIGEQKLVSHDLGAGRIVDNTHCTRKWAICWSSQHSGVNQLTLSCDGSQIAITSKFEVISICDIKSQRLIQTKRKISSMGIQFSLDGQQICCGLGGAPRRNYTWIY